MKFREALQMPEKIKGSVEAAYTISIIALIFAGIALYAATQKRGD